MLGLLAGAGIVVIKKTRSKEMDQDLNIETSTTGVITEAPVQSVERSSQLNRQPLVVEFDFPEESQ